MSVTSFNIHHLFLVMVRVLLFLCCAADAVTGRYSLNVTVIHILDRRNYA